MAEDPEPLRAWLAGRRSAPGGAQEGEAVAKAAPAGSQRELAGRALEIASDPLRAGEAARALLEGMRTAGTVRAEEAKVSLVSRLSEAAGFGPLFPLRPAELAVPFGAIKLAGYRSGSSYVSAVRRTHVRLGHALTDTLRE